MGESLETAFGGLLRLLEAKLASTKVQRPGVRSALCAPFTVGEAERRTGRSQNEECLTAVQGDQRCCLLRVHPPTSPFFVSLYASGKIESYKSF